MKVYCVMVIEHHVGEFLVKILSTRDKAEAYIVEAEKVSGDDFEIVEWSVDE